MDAGGLKIGVNVDIQRTDGRIHSAVVSGINMDTRSVTVEWFERGETKGKEIEMDTIYNLNPGLQPEPPSQAPEKPAFKDQEDSNRNYQKPLEVGSKATHKGEKMRVRPSYVKMSQLPNQQQQHQQQNGTTPSNNDNDTFSNISKTGSQSQGQGKGQRRATVVNKIEEIKEKRENRRAKQAEMRQAKDDENMKDHPCWEFLQMIREYRSTLDYHAIGPSDPIQDHQICVCVRKRPLNKKELNKRDIDVVTIADGYHTLIHEPKTKVDMTKYLENQTFRLDYSFDDSVSNETVYRYTARPLVETIFEGGMATCFAYGQTGSGKTHTMGGEFVGKSQEVNKGIYAMASKDVFKLINSNKYQKQNLQVSCSYFEIYSGKVFDLLNKKQKLRVLEDGKQQVQVVGLKEEDVSCVEDVLKLIGHGNGVRTSGQTAANQHSSRSHAVFQIILRKRGLRRQLHGKFSLIDLAGNERGADTSSSDRQTRMEGAEINKSLLALKECIRALGRAKGAHLPFRASKLTQVLRDSFIGDNSRTCMIAMISPGLTCCEHTLNTLRYADRVKELGPGGPVEARPMILATPDRGRSPTGGAMSPANSDLAMLYTQNEGDEDNAELYTFQETVNHLQEMEEDVIDDLRNMIQQEQGWVKEKKLLLDATNEVDYDVESFAVKLEEMVDSEVAELMKFKSKVKAFRQQLQEEEKISRSVKKRPNKY